MPSYYIQPVDVYLWRLRNLQELKFRVNEYYGDDLVPLAFPDGWRLEEVKMACSDDKPMTDGEIRGALDDSVGAANISEQARGKRGKVVITCDDLSRPTPADRVFPFLVEQLHEAGVPDSRIFILGSFGCHLPMNLDAFARKLGDWTVARYDCVNHNPFNSFENLGRTSRGTPLLVNKEFSSADLRICISGVKKHGFAGAGGGGKAIIPGVTSADTIYYNHFVIEGRRGGDRRIWGIKKNQERLDMQEAARMADLNVSVNCVYNGRRQLIGLAAGDVDDAWHQAVKECYRAHASKPARKADVVVVNAYPQAQQDIDWWGAQESLREGGTAVAVHHFAQGSRLLHYMGEQLGEPWKRLQGYPSRSWPVEKAGNILVYTNRLSKRQMLLYDEKIEWITDWNMVERRLQELHGGDASVALYPHAKLQFDGDKNPLDL